MKLFVVVVCFCFGAGGGPVSFRAVKGEGGPVRFGVWCETVRRRRRRLFFVLGRAGGQSALEFGVKLFVVAVVVAVAVCFCFGAGGGPVSFRAVKGEGPSSSSSSPSVFVSGLCFCFGAGGGPVSFRAVKLFAVAVCFCFGAGGGRRPLGHQSGRKAGSVILHQRGELLHKPCLHASEGRRESYFELRRIERSRKRENESSGSFFARASSSSSVRSHEDLAKGHPLAENSVAALQLFNALPSSATPPSKPRPSPRSRRRLPCIPFRSRLSC